MLAGQAKLMESYGAHCVYVTDSGGRLTMDGVRDRVRAYRDLLDPATELGIHAHQNLSLAVANSVVAVEERRHPRRRLAGRDGRRSRQLPDRAAHRRRQHLRAGSTAATCSPCKTRPTTWSARCRTGPCRSTARPSPSATPACTPASCATPNAPPRTYGIDTRDILVEVGRRGLVGGQEDMIIDVTLDLIARRDQAGQQQPAEVPA